MNNLSYEQKLQIFCEELASANSAVQALRAAHKRGAIAQYDRKAYYEALALVGNPDERSLDK